MNALKEKLARALALPAATEWGLDLRNEWSSRSPDHRKLIRKAISEHLKDASAEDLSRLPSITGISTSISHSPVVGGYAWKIGHAIGIDVEASGRVREETLFRFASEAEVNEAHELKLPATAIWSAKEASFKAHHRNDQPQVMTMMTVISWTKVEEALYGFAVHLNDKEVGRGACWIGPDYTVSVAVR